MGPVICDDWDDGSFLSPRRHIATNRAMAIHATATARAATRVSATTTSSSRSQKRDARARATVGRRDIVMIGAASAMVGGRDARAVETATEARLTDIGELGIGTWSWGNTAVWVRARARSID